LILVWQVSNAQIAPTDNTNNNTANNKDKDKDKDKSKDDINPFFAQIATPDRSTERQLEQIERLIKVKRYEEAVKIIGALLEKSDNFLIPPPFSPRQTGGKNTAGTNPEERTTNTSFTKRLITIFQNLPEQAKEIYYLQYKTQAESLLDNAIKQGSLETLQKVAQQYLPTEAGLTAQFLAGMYQFELGNCETALLAFYKIHQLADLFNFKLEPYEPSLSLAIATCQIKLNRDGDANQTLDNFLKRFPRPQILLNGKEVWRPTTSAELFTRIKNSTTDNNARAQLNAQWLEQTGWLLPRGIPSQNPETLATPPLLETVWEMPNFDKDEIATIAKRLQSTVQSATDTYIPAQQPIVINNIVVTRGLDEISAINIETGKRIWRQNDNNYQISTNLMPMLQHNINTFNSVINKQYQQGLMRINLWHDRIANSITSDGEKVFYIEGHNQKLSPYSRNIQQQIFIKNKAVENPLTKNSNTLTARDAKTGNLIWQIGKVNYVQKTFNKIDAELKENPQQFNNTNEYTVTPDPDNKEKDKDKDKEKEKEKEKKAKEAKALFTDEELILSETQFLGAPLPLYGNLYCICECDGLLQLFVLKSSDGKLLSKIPLAQPAQRLETNVLRGLYCLTPSASNGIIFCPTGLGMVVAVDATTVTPLWCFSYEQVSQTPAPDVRFGGGGGVIRVGVAIGNRGVVNYIDPNTTNNDYFRQLFSQSGWQAPCIMIDGSRVLIAPPDVPALYCVDLLTGKLLWQMTNLYRQNALYVACIHNNIAYVVTPVSVLALSMESGRRIWEQVLASQIAQNENAQDQITAKNRVVVRGGGGGVIRIQQQAPFQQKAPNVIQPVTPIKRTITPEQNDSDKLADNNSTTNNNQTKRPKLVFPTTLKPAGTGVHNGDLYYIPLTGGYTGIINLTKCTLNLIASPDSVINAEKQEIAENNKQNQNNLASKGSNFSFGNLIGLRGKFFSQSPFQMICFDQWLDLKTRTDRMLAANPDDANGLLQLGYIRRLENNTKEAIRLFRRSLEINYTEVAAHHLRQALMDAVKKDYHSWKHVLPELESLALTPVEYGDVLFAQAQGASQSGDVDDFISTLAKVFNIESDLPVNITIDDTLTSQLHNAVGLLMEQMKQKHEDQQIMKKINLAAESIFNNFRNDNFNLKPAQNAEQSNPAEHQVFQDSLQFILVNDINTFSPEIRTWQIFIELFRALPVAEEAKNLLIDYCKKNQIYFAIEILNELPILNNENNLNNAENISAENNNKENKNGENNKNVKSKNRNVAKLPKLVDLEMLAGQLETHGVISEAYYYYKIIDKLYGDKGKNIAKKAFERAVLKDYIKRKSAPPSKWADGNVTVEVKNNDTQRNIGQIGVARNRVPIARNQNAYLVLQLARGINRGQNTRQSAPAFYFGDYEPFISPYSYAVELRDNVLTLAAYDDTGKEHWQFDLSEHFETNILSVNDTAEHVNQRVFDLKTKIIKGCEHLLIFACADKMIAIDTFGCGKGSSASPKFLWARTTTGNNNYFSEKVISNDIVLRAIYYGGMNGYGGIMQTPTSGHNVMLCVTKNVICYRDNNKLYGINPINGNIIWTRDIQSESCSIFGDRDSLFLFYRESQRILAIEPLSGIEIKRGIITGEILASYGSNILIENKLLSGRSRLLATDLNDIFLDDGAVRLCDNFNGAVQNELVKIAPDAIPTRVIWQPSENNWKIKQMENLQYVAISARKNNEQRLFIYDTKNKTFVTGENESNGTCNGINLLNAFGIAHNNNMLDFQVSKNNDNFLVTFVTNATYGNRQSMRITDNDGQEYTRQCSPLMSINSQNGTEFFMLFDKKGNQCWKESISSNEWFLIADSLSDNVPVILYAAIIRDNAINSSKYRSYIGVTAIDKNTGRKRFRKILPYDVRSGNMQMLKLEVDKDSRELKLICPDRIIAIKFEDELKEKNKTKDEPNDNSDNSNNNANDLKEQVENIEINFM
jgi:outer membrane protein assembly factor BamB